MESSIYIRDIREEDKYRFTRWGEFEDPLLFGYNYRDLTFRERNTWYKRRKKGLFKRTFAIIHKEFGFIGYMALKRINPFTRSSTLGIVFDPRYVSKGFGKIALSKLLDIYFNKMKMRKMKLEVNSFNKRARNLYEGLSFEYVGKGISRFENQDITRRYLRERNLLNEFIFLDNIVYSKILMMELKDRRYYEISAK